MCARETRMKKMRQTKTIWKEEREKEHRDRTSEYLKTKRRGQRSNKTKKILKVLFHVVHIWPKV